MAELLFQLKQNLEIYLKRFAFSYTYPGILEDGDIIPINRNIIEEKVPMKAALSLFDQAYSRSLPIHVRYPKADKNTGKLPTFTCFALFHGPMVEGRKDPQDKFAFGSRVGYCWFTNEVDLRLSELVETGLEPFDWNAIAENYGIYTILGV